MCQLEWQWLNRVNSAAVRAFDLRLVESGWQPQPGTALTGYSLVAVQVPQQSLKSPGPVGPLRAVPAARGAPPETS